MTETNKNNIEEEAYRAEIREKYAHDSTKKSKKTYQGRFGGAVIIIIVISFIIYGIFNFGGNKSSSTLSSIVLPSIKEKPEETGESKVSLESHTKEFNENSYPPQITFALKFWNNTDKDIRGFEGIVTYSDIF